MQRVREEGVLSALHCQRDFRVQAHSCPGPDPAADSLRRVPVAQFRLPQFGDIHDDSVYYVSAKSLASGRLPHREPSRPQPFQTKYPPLYPLLLSIAWRVNPRFPQNLPIAAWLSWLALPLMLAVLAALYPRMGIAGWRSGCC